MANVRNRVKFVFAFGFAFVTGWVDMVCYTRFRTFATMMTGNLIMMCVTIGTSGFKTIKSNQDGLLPDVPFYALVISTYFIGVVLYRVVEAKLPFCAGTVLSPIIVLLIILEEVALAETDIPSRWCCFMLAPVFGIQNSAVSRKGISAATAFATGHIHTIAYAFSAAIEQCRCSVGDCQKIMVNTGAVIGLASGVIAGGMVIAGQKVPRDCGAQYSCVEELDITLVNSTAMLFPNFRGFGEFPFLLRIILFDGVADHFVHHIGHHLANHIASAPRTRTLPIADCS